VNTKTTAAGIAALETRSNAAPSDLASKSPPPRVTASRCPRGSEPPEKTGRALLSAWGSVEPALIHIHRHAAIAVAPVVWVSSLEVPSRASAVGLFVFVDELRFRSALSVAQYLAVGVVLENVGPITVAHRDFVPAADYLKAYSSNRHQDGLGLGIANRAEKVVILPRRGPLAFVNPVEKRRILRFARAVAAARVPQLRRTSTIACCNCGVSFVGRPATPQVYTLSAVQVGRFERK
jgi:hypothetical protein